MTAARIWAVVPVKPFEIAKHRLAGVLTAAQRAQLAQVMADDVLDVLVASTHVLAGILVVTADPEVAALAARRGAQVLIEPAPTGINAALTLAAGRIVADDNKSGMIVVPTDLPQITTDAVEYLVRLLDAERAVALVPAAEDGGTNMFACRPAGMITPSFGPGSFVRHQTAALAAGIVPAVLALPNLAYDIDRPSDLVAFRSLRTATRTQHYLARLMPAESLSFAPQTAGAQPVRLS
jgi:2-phospho-L-lactate guanylyltransferase